MTPVGGRLVRRGGVVSVEEEADRKGGEEMDETAFSAALDALEPETQSRQ